MTITGILKERAQREPFDMFKNMAEGAGGPPPPMGGGEGGPPMPGNIFGKDENAGSAIVINQQGVDPSTSRSSFVLGGQYDSQSATGLKIVADDGSTGGVYVSGEGVKYTVSDAVIRLSGNSQGLGGMTSGVAADNGAELTLKNSLITTTGKARSATSATNSSTLWVYDSKLVCHGAPFSEDAPTPSGRQRDIQGNARCHITMGNSKSYFYNSMVVADGWAALSTDIAQGYVYIEANDCQLETTNSGYAAYADGGCDVVLNRCNIKSACMAGVIAGEASIAYNGCNVHSGTFGTKFHCIGQPQEVGALQISDCNYKSQEQCIVVNSHNAEISCTGSRFDSQSGIALEVRKNPDPNAAKTEGKWVYGVHASFDGCQINGGIINTDGDRTTSVYLKNSVLVGAMNNVELWMQDGGRWYANADSQVILVGDAELNQFDAPTGVTITAQGCQSGRFDLPSGGKLDVIE